MSDYMTNDLDERFKPGQKKKKQKNESFGSLMTSFFQQLVRDGRLRSYGACPQCATGTLYAFYDRKNKRARSLPACPTCGYKQTNGQPVQSQAEREKLELIAARKDAVNYLINSSVFTDKTVVEKDFGNFKIKSDKQRQAVKVAQQIIQDVMAGNPVNAMFTGPTGTGKTHLAMATMYEILEKSRYHKRCIFVNYRKLLSQIKQGMSDPEAQKKYGHLIADQLSKADLVVIDDLGSEINDNGTVKQATQFDIEQITDIYDGRVGKCTITTTNWTGRDLMNIYGRRALSRMSEHSMNHIFNFEGIQDQRLLESKS